MNSRPPPSASTPHGTRTGFTLFELLVVITIMIFISTIAVMNYIGVMRGAGFTTASSNIFNALLMARQRACLDNKPVVLYLLDKTNYVVQIAYSSVARIDALSVAERAVHPTPGCKKFWDPDQIATPADTNTPLLNLDRPGATATLVCMPDFVPATDSTSMIISNVNTSGELQQYRIAALRYYVVLNGDWAAGDRYGVQAFTPLSLPKGFEFFPNPLSVSASQRMVLFKPDGTIDTLGGLNRLVVLEPLKNKRLAFSMDTSGKITQE